MDLITYKSWIWTHISWIWTRNSQYITRVLLSTSEDVFLLAPLVNFLSVLISFKGLQKATDVGNDNEPNLNYINKFKNNPSIKVVKSRNTEEQTFTFSYVSYEEVLNKIRKLQTATRTQQNDIPTKILKENSEVFARNIHKT